MAAHVDRKPVAACIAFTAGQKQVVPAVCNINPEAGQTLRQVIEKITGEPKYSDSTHKIKMPPQVTAASWISAFLEWIEQNIRRDFLGELYASLKKVAYSLTLNPTLQKVPVSFI